MSGDYWMIVLMSWVALVVCAANIWACIVLLRIAGQYAREALYWWGGMSAILMFIAILQTGRHYEALSTYDIFALTSIRGLVAMGGVLISARIWLFQGGHREEDLTE